MLWRVTNKDEDLALRLITAKRKQLDEKLASIPGVHFFVSSIQGVTSNKKRKRSSGNRESEEPSEVPGSQTQLEMAEDDSAELFNPIQYGGGGALWPPTVFLQYLQNDLS